MTGNTLQKNDYVVRYGGYNRTPTTYNKEAKSKNEIITIKTGDFPKYDMENVLLFKGVTETDIVIHEEVKNLKIKNMEYEKEMVVMKNKLNNCVPVHTIVYLIVNSMLSSVSVLLIILRYSKNLYIIDPYYLFCAAIISFGLLLTALASVKDWKEYMTSGKER